jgi:hypothetical protein
MRHLQLLPAAVLGSNLAAHLAATRYMRSRTAFSRAHVHAHTHTLNSSLTSHFPPRSSQCSHEGKRGKANFQFWQTFWLLRKRAWVLEPRHCVLSHGMGASLARAGRPDGACHHIVPARLAGLALLDWSRSAKSFVPSQAQPLRPSAQVGQP